MVDVQRGYGEGRDPIPALDEPTLMFMINRSLPKQWDQIDVYRATQCGWVIGEHARARGVYALGVSNGVVGTSIARIRANQGASNPVRLHLAGIPAEPSVRQ